MTHSIYLAMSASLEMQYSVFPCRADKLPAMDWKQFQSRRATKNELQAWSEQGKLTEAYAIVTGSISRLYVIDLDSAAAIQSFQSRFGFIYDNTQRIQTARGEHIYLTGAHLKSAQFNGVDIQSDGRYVIGNRSRIAGHLYSSAGKGKPYSINAHEAGELAAWAAQFHKSQRKETTNPRADQVEASQRKIKLTAAMLQANYQRQLLISGSRNKALFDSALLARDCGRSIEWTIGQLYYLHIDQPKAGTHETASGRGREALKTISSAYSRPARDYAGKLSTTIPTAIREWLGQHEQMSIARTLDAARLAGIAPGQQFTASELLETLRGIIGKHSVETALKSAFFAAMPPSGHPQSAKALDCDKATTDIHNLQLCNFGQNREKVSQGRPAQTYVMLSDAELFALTGLEYEPFSDVISLDECKSIKSYRAALHRELIRRRPGIYSQAWLAGRLGISTRTIRRYNDLEGIFSQDTFTETPIHLDNLDFVPNVREFGLFLLINGKKWPAMRGIAERALKRNQRVSLMDRRYKYYWYSPLKPLVLTSGAYLAPYTSDTEQAAWREVHNQQAISHRAAISKAPGALPALPAPEIPPMPELPRYAAAPARDRKTERAYRNKARQYRKPLTDSAKERLAQRIYSTVGNIRLTTARHAATICTPADIQHGLAVVERYTSKEIVSNRAGLFLTACSFYFRKKG